jgi:hypothetical protein
MRTHEIWVACLTVSLFLRLGRNLETISRVMRRSSTGKTVPVCRPEQSSVYINCETALGTLRTNNVIRPSPKDKRKTPACGRQSRCSARAHHFVGPHHFVVLMLRNVTMPHVAAGESFKGDMMRVIRPGSARTISFQPLSIHVWISRL